MVHLLEWNASLTGSRLGRSGDPCPPFLIEISQAEDMPSNIVCTSWEFGRYLGSSMKECMVDKVCLSVSPHSFLFKFAFQNTGGMLKYAQNILNTHIFWGQKWNMCNTLLNVPHIYPIFSPPILHITVHIPAHFSHILGPKVCISSPCAPSLLLWENGGHCWLFDVICWNCQPFSDSPWEIYHWSVRIHFIVEFWMYFNWF